MTVASEEIKLRIDPAQKDAIQRAAQATGVNLSQFIRDAAQQRADELIAEIQFRQTSTVPPATFDRLLDALDEPAAPSARLVEAAEKLRALNLD